MMILKALLIGSSVVLSFLIGLYTMYRVSEHYNNIIRDKIEEKYELNDEKLFTPQPVAPPRKRPAPKKAEEAKE